MRKHYILSTVLCSSLGFLSCSSESDDRVQPVDSPSVSSPAETEITAIEFPTDDGSVFLNGENNENLLRLLKRIDTQRALVLGETRITDGQYAEIKAFTDELVAQCADDKAKYDVIFRWVATNIKHGNADNDPYPVFISKKGVCQGFSNLLKVMMLTQDIPVMVVNGYIYGLGHAWNYVCCDGTWMVADATNGGSFKADAITSYSHLSPVRADIVMFEDEQFAYDYYEGNLNVMQIKTVEEQVTIPYSVNGFRTTSLILENEMPESVRVLYVGKNIETFGREYLGLKDHGRNLEAIHVDEKNYFLCSYEGAVYEKSGANRYLYYIPGRLTDLKLLPMETVEKNTVFDQPYLKTIEFPQGTVSIEAYAVEKCPALEKAYVPLSTTIEDDAFYDVAPNFEVVRRNGTGITNVWM